MSGEHIVFDRDLQRGDIRETSASIAHCENHVALIILSLYNALIIYTSVPIYQSIPPRYT